jgi:hypothetical protein
VAAFLPPSPFARGSRGSHSVSQLVRRSCSRRRWFCLVRFSPPRSSLSSSSSSSSSSSTSHSGCGGGGGRRRLCSCGRGKLGGFSPGEWGFNGAAIVSFNQKTARPTPVGRWGRHPQHEKHTEAHRLCRRHRSGSFSSFERGREKRRRGREHFLAVAAPPEGENGPGIISSAAAAAAAAADFSPLRRRAKVESSFIKLSAFSFSPPSSPL